jgi:hypothetical protein
MKRKRAWLISWDVLDRGGATDVIDGQVVAFLDARLGDESVRQAMKALWIACGRRTWDERLIYATGRLSTTFYQKDVSRIVIGFKPRLVGRIVEDIEVTDEEDGGRVSWTEIVYSKADATGRHPAVRRRMRQSKLPSSI